MGEDHGLIAPRTERARLLKRFGLEWGGFCMATGDRQAVSERLRGEHLRVTTADPDRDFESFAYVVEALVNRASIDLAVPHHNAIGRCNARKAVSLAKRNAIGEMAQRGRHAAIHILRVGETAQRPGLPLGRVDPPRRLERAFVLGAARRQLAAREMEVAAKVVNFGERAIIEIGGRRWFGLSEGGKGVVQPGDEAIGGGAPDQRARRLGPSRAQRCSP